MDIKDLRGLMEAYQQVNASQEVEEAYKEFPREKVRAKADALKAKADKNEPISHMSDSEISNLGTKKDKMRSRASAMGSASNVGTYSHSSNLASKRNKERPEDKKRSRTVEEIEIDEAERPIYGRGGGLKRTQTSLQVLGKHATARDKKKLHNIPKGGTTIGTGDSGKLMSGEYDRGKGSKAARRAAALSKPEPKKSFPNRLRRSDGQGIRDSYEYDIFDVVLEFLQVNGYAETLEEAEWMMANLLDKEAIDIIVEASCEDDEEDEKEMKKGKKSKKEEEDEEEELDEALTGERYKKVMKKPGGTAYSRKVSADPAKRATRGGKGGESDFGAGDRGSGNKAARRAGTYQEEEFAIDEATYSAKAARAGKDIGKPGKAFAKIAKSAAKRYGSKERGEKVAGAVLAKLRAKGG